MKWNSVLFVCDFQSCLRLGTASAYKFLNEVIPADIYDDSSADRLVAIRPFYQFTCLILLLQATLFYAPHVISRELCRFCGIQPDELALSAVEARHTRDTDEKDAAIRDLATHVYTFCLRQLQRRHMSYCFRWLYGMKLSLIQLLIKSLYVANVIGQFYMLDAFLGVDFHSLGWSVIGRKGPPAIDGTSHTDLQDAQPKQTASSNSSNIFPNEILCDFKTRRLGNIQRYTVHCLLPLNNMNGILFHYVWFLLFGVGIITVVSLMWSMFKLIAYP